MSPQVVLFLVGIILVIVSLIGGGMTAFQVQIPKMPKWTRSIIGIIGAIVFIVAFFPNAYSASQAVSGPSQNAGPTAGSASASASRNVSVRSSFSSSPTPTPTPMVSQSRSTVPGPLRLSLHCTLQDPVVRAGTTVEMTYDFSSNEIAEVGLGVGLYDDQGTDYSDGTGDIDTYLLVAGKSAKTRPVNIPGNLHPGTYELDAEIWPPNKIGADGANTLAEDTCAFFTVH
jgi:hypothetical protein